MNRKIYGAVLTAGVCLCFGLTVGCNGGPSHHTIAITATSGSGQTATNGEAFTNQLTATVTSNGNAASGITVTFVPPSTGASCTPSETTVTTGSNGEASITCTANSTAGSYDVTASATGATGTASFSETNAAPSVFVFYVSGMKTNSEGKAPYYALVGAVSFDSNGNVLGGEEDYNDGGGVTAGDVAISASGSSMTVNTSTSTGTLILATSNTSLGANGVETFAIQFINAKHALISQFDGTATSSGSMDLQTATAGSGNYAFTMSGVDISHYEEFGVGGVFTISSGALTGMADVNDVGTVTLATAGNFVGTVNAADSYGRGTITPATINGNSYTPVYYVVGSEAIRIIDMDTTGVFVGSAYGQGSTASFDSTALGKADVLAIQGTPYGYLYASTGNLVPSGAATGVASASFSGEGDYYDETGKLVTASTTGGSYTVASNGYGSVSNITGLGYETTLGLYATDPSLDLLDPNNSSGGGSALLLDLLIPGGTGIVVPQASTTAATDLNNSYGFGAQEFTNAATENGGWEFDYVAQGTISSLALSGTGDVSDPFAFFLAHTAGEYKGVPFAGTAGGPDAAGRYTYGSTTPFAVGPVGTNATANDFTVVLYEANSGLVFSIVEDSTVLSLGTFQEQNTSSLKATLMKEAPAKDVRAQVNQKR